MWLQNHVMYVYTCIYMYHWLTRLEKPPSSDTGERVTSSLLANDQPLTSGTRNTIHQMHREHNANTYVYYKQVSLKKGHIIRVHHNKYVYIIIRMYK